MNSKTLVVYILFNEQHKPFYVGSGTLYRAEESRQIRKALHYEIICTVRSKELMYMLEAATIHWLRGHHPDTIQNKSMPFNFKKFFLEVGTAEFIMKEEWKEKARIGREKAIARGIKFGRKKKD